MSNRKNFNQHQLVGYDQRTERRQYSIDIPLAKMDMVRQLVHFEKDDPQGFDSYKVDYPIARELAGIVEAGSPPTSLDYFLECFEKVSQ